MVRWRDDPDRLLVRRRVLHAATISGVRHLLTLSRPKVRNPCMHGVLWLLIGLRAEGFIDAILVGFIQEKVRWVLREIMALVIAVH